MRKLWILPAIFVTALMASAAYGGSLITVAPVNQVTVSPNVNVSPKVSPNVSPNVSPSVSNSTQVTNQVAVGVLLQSQAAAVVAIHGNANSTQNAVGVNPVITKATVINFGH